VKLEKKNARKTGDVVMVRSIFYSAQKQKLQLEPGKAFDGIILPVR
jgi:hypothetical protein